MDGRVGGQGRAQGRGKITNQRQKRAIPGRIQEARLSFRILSCWVPHRISNAHYNVPDVTRGTPSSIMHACVQFHCHLAYSILTTWREYLNKPRAVTRCPSSPSSASPRKGRARVIARRQQIGASLRLSVSLTRLIRDVVFTQQSTSDFPRLRNFASRLSGLRSCSSPPTSHREG